MCSFDINIGWVLYSAQDYYYYFGLSKILIDFGLKARNHYFKKETVALINWYIQVF